MKNTLLFLLILCFHISFSQIDRSQPPHAEPYKKVLLKSPKSFTLENGLRVLVVSSHKLPTFSIQLTIDNPPVTEKDKAGVGSLTGQLLGSGTEEESKDAFNEEIDFLGAHVSFTAQSAAANGLSKHFSKILNLMADAAINPKFTAEEFNKKKTLFITSIKTAENDVAAISERAQATLAYGKNHPYGEITTEETINNVTLNAIKNYYQSYFTPNNAYLVIIGDVHYKTVKKLVTRAFDSWANTAVPIADYKTPENAPVPQINFINMDNAVQSEISVQHLVNLKMNDPDYLAIIIANQILGGGDGRLFANLREDKAYTYGAYSTIRDNKYNPVRFNAFAKVRNIVTDSAIVQILKEIDDITNQPINPEELALVKAKYTGNFIMALEKAQTIANYAVNIEKENLTADFYTSYLERIAAISIEDVQHAAKKYFGTKNTRIIVVSKKDEVFDNLKKIKLNNQYLPVIEYDKYINIITKY